MNSENIEIQKSLSKRTNRQSINGQIIFIYNFGDKRICDSLVRPHDVRIFMLSVDNYQRLHLNSSLIQPTLKQLRDLNIVSENEKTYNLKLCNIFNFITLNYYFYDLYKFAGFTQARKFYQIYFCVYLTSIYVS